MKATNPTTQAQRRYMLQITLAMASYVLILWGTRAALHNLSGPSAVVAELLPVVPVALVFVAVLRWLRGTDEFNRRIVVDALAIAGGTTALLSAAYGFIEGDPLPRPSAWWVWTVFMLLWLAASIVLRRRYRE